MATPKKPTRSRTRKSPATKGQARTPPARHTTKTKGRKPAKAKTAQARAKAADKVASKAKDAGATGGNLRAADRQLRDSAIVARFAAGWTQEMIAEEFAITDRQVRRVLDKRRHGSPLDSPPMELVEDFARGIHASVGDFEAMAHRWREANPSVALGAKKAANEARREMRELLVALGLWPDDLSSMRGEAELQRIVGEMLDKVEELVRGAITAADLRDYLDELTLREDDPRLQVLGK